MDSKIKVKIISLSFIQERNQQLLAEAVDPHADDEAEDDDFISTLPPVLQERLFDHQRTGVSWMYRKFKNKSGGILGDDMGLGKTFQVTTLLCGLMCKKEVKRVLIVCPVSVTQSWSRELRDHAKPYLKTLKVDILNSEMPKKQRERTLREIFMVNKPRIVITTYSLFTNMVDHFSLNGKWDYCILDEGHTIKNPTTKMNKACHAVEARHRLLLSGTPIQNNMMELHALVSWVSQCSLLGSAAAFKMNYADPIMYGQDPDMYDFQRQKAVIAAANLKTLLQPILLQRKKTDFEQVLQLPDKLELAVWVPLSPRQRGLYSQYLEGRQLQQVLSQNSYPIEAVNYLKTLCRHPFLTEATIATKRGRTGESSVSSDCNIDDLTSALGCLGIMSGSAELEEQQVAGGVFSIVGRIPSVGELLADSVKLQVFLALTRELRRAGHRTLVFSQSKLMLDIIQRVLTEEGMATARIDGSVCGRERQEVIDNVNDENSRVEVCLLTTKACGFGITLTGADRVIVFDPSWNPAEDRQAVDRAYRIGQKSDVVVYRLIMAGTVEEKMYEKQVFKDGLRVVAERGSSKRYFSDRETKELFVLDGHAECACMRRLWGFDQSCKIESCPDMSTALEGVMGYSKHDALYLASLQAKDQGEKGQGLNHATLDMTRVNDDDSDGSGDDDDARLAREREKSSADSNSSRPTQRKIDSIFKPAQLDTAQRPVWPDRRAAASSTLPAWPARERPSQPVPAAAPLFIDLTDSPEKASVPLPITGPQPRTSVQDTSTADLLKDLESMCLQPRASVKITATDEESHVAFTGTTSAEDVSTLLIEKSCRDSSSDDGLVNFHLDLSDLHNQSCANEEEESCTISHGNANANENNIGENERLNHSLGCEGSLLEEASCGVNYACEENSLEYDALVDSDSDIDDKHIASRRVNSRIRLSSMQNKKTQSGERNASSSDAINKEFIVSDSVFESSDEDEEEEADEACNVVNVDVEYKPEYETGYYEAEAEKGEDEVSADGGGFVVPGTDDESEEREELQSSNENPEEESESEGEDLLDSDSDDESHRMHKEMNSRIRLMKHVTRVSRKTSVFENEAGVVGGKNSEDEEEEEEEDEEDEEEDDTCGGFIVPDDSEEEEEDSLQDSDSEEEKKIEAVSRGRRLGRGLNGRSKQAERRKFYIDEAEEEEEEEDGENDTCGGFIVPDDSDEEEGEALGESDIDKDEEDDEEDEEDDTCGGFIVPDDSEEEEEDSLQDSDSEEERGSTINEKENTRNFNDFSASGSGSSRRREVVDLRDTDSDEECSRKTNKGRGDRRRRGTLVKKPLDKQGKNNEYSFAREIASFQVQEIPVLSVQRSYNEMKLKAPALHRLVVKPRKSLNLHQINEYNDCLMAARRQESRTQWLQAAEMYCRAVAICDDDSSLHKKLFLFEKMLA